MLVLRRQSQDDVEKLVAGPDNVYICNESGGRRQSRSQDRLVDSKAFEARQVMQAPGENVFTFATELGGGVVSICGNYGPKEYRWVVSVLLSADSSR
jgi:ClpX C4-type zinc finger